MKKCMFVLFVLNLVMVNGLSASAAAAAAAGAGRANVAAQNRVKIPAYVDTDIAFGQPDGIIHWLNENPLNKDAINEKDGKSLLMVLALNCSWDTEKAFFHLIAMRPNALVQDNNGEDVLDTLLSRLVFFPLAMKKKIANAIVALMIEQGADIRMLLRRVYAKKNALEKLIEQLAVEDENPMVDEKGNAQAQYDAVMEIIDLLEKEQAKLELKDAKEELVSQGHLVRDIGKILAPSDPRLLAIKHAIEDNNAEKLAKALEGNKLLEIKDAAGYTPFLYAAYIGKPDMMRDLIRQGANIDAKTKDGAQAKDFGDYQKLINEERLARERTMEEEKKAKQAQLEAERRLLFENIKQYQRRGLSDNPEIINYRDENGYTPLMVAASLGKAWYVAQLLYNADTSLRDSDNNTALHLAIINGHFNIANLLIPKMNQQSIEAKNKGGFTAYDLAIKYTDKYKDNADFQRLMEAFKKHGYPKN